MYISKSDRDIAQPGLARLSGGQKVGSSNLPIPTIFLPGFQKIVSKLCKKQATDWKINFHTVAFLFLHLHFFVKKMSLLTSLGELPSLRSGTSGSALRRISLSRPFFCPNSGKKMVNEDASLLFTLLCNKSSSLKTKGFLPCHGVMQ